MEAQKKNILIVNAICIVIGLVPIVGLFVVPLLFIVNFILALVKFYNKEQEVALTYLIVAFLAPLIGYSLCYGVYGGLNFL